MPRLRTAAAVFLPVVLVCCAGASAAGPQPPNCPLFVARAAAEHPFVMPDGSRLVARDPYGGLLSRDNRYFSFSVRGRDGGAPRGIAQVTWALDGRVLRTDPSPPFAWKRLSSSERQMPAGDHRVTVTATLEGGGGGQGSTTFPLTATDCQPASGFTVIDEVLDGPERQRGSELQVESSGPAIRSVSFSSTDVLARLPAAVRGRAGGSLRVGPDGGTFALRTPRSGNTLLRRGGLRVVLYPGARRFLTLRGLPAGAGQIEVRLIGRGGASLLRVRPTRPRGCTRVTATIAGAQGSVRANVGGECTSVS